MEEEEAFEKAWRKEALRLKEAQKSMSTGELCKPTPGPEDSDDENDEHTLPYEFCSEKLRPGVLTSCVYCRAGFVVGNYGTLYLGKGFCYSCITMKRKEKEMVWEKEKH